MIEAELRAAVDSEMQALQEFFVANDDIVDTRTAVLFLKRNHGLRDEEIQLLLQGKGRLEVVEE